MLLEIGATAWVLAGAVPAVWIEREMRQNGDRLVHRALGFTLITLSGPIFPLVLVFLCLKDYYGWDFGNPFGHRGPGVE